MAADLDQLLPAISPKRQEDILSQLDDETAAQYRAKGYGLPKPDPPTIPPPPTTPKEPSSVSAPQRSSAGTTGSTPTTLDVKSKPTTTATGS